MKFNVIGKEGNKRIKNHISSYKRQCHKGRSALLRNKKVTFCSNGAEVAIEQHKASSTEKYIEKVTNWPTQQHTISRVIECCAQQKLLSELEWKDIAKILVKLIFL